MAAAPLGWIGACGGDDATFDQGSTATSGSGGEGGTACQAPLEDCGGECVHTPSDPQHCGACDNACGAEQVCLEGQCECSPGVTACGDDCIDVATDPAHCGSCDKACLTGQTCSDGACGDCPQGQVACLEQGTCADLSSDPKNCGKCGADCGSGTCTNGVCACTGGLEPCSDGCVDTQTDAGNCGGCGNGCLSGQVCEQGMCTDCPSGTVACTAQGVCADLSSDDGNCGQCGKSCGPGGDCVSGNCVCKPGSLNCGPIFGCVDPTSDEAHCGGCGEKCPTDATCSNGVCQCNSAGELACGLQCVDTSTNLEHCGSCGNDCDSLYGTCISGACGCVGGLQACGGNNACTDGLNDANHCGQCGKQCADGETCDKGQCVCRPGLTLINGQCIDTKSNPAHCGAPNSPCGGNTPRCELGQCVGDCQVLPDNCGNACVDQDSDPLHCGGCGLGDVCDSDEVCVNGDCRAWHPAVGCNSCPCALSCTGDFDECCTYPGSGLTICVDAGSCPQ